MVERVFRRQKGEPIDLEAVEKALREMGQRLSGSVLEKVLNTDGGLYQGSQIDCGKGHQARYVEQREKQLVTVVGTVQVRRAYYHCVGCRAGVFPKDVELDIVGTSFSPGVKRMMGYVGGREPFENGRMSLKELAGVEISTKAVERTAEAIGEEIEEMTRRELEMAMSEKVVIGDGAPWIWGVADMHFPGGIQIVDLYHALERVAEVSKTVFGTESSKWKEWAQSRGEALKRGDVELVIRNLRRLRPRAPKAKKVVAAAIEYFQRNRERMRYGKFRDAGLFIGSGVVEAGCKNVIGKRLKQSGMWWTVRGANSIIWLRCCQLSGRWEDHWELRRAA